MSKRVIEIEALRQVAFPGFPDYDDLCEVEGFDAGDQVEWICTRHPGHEGPHFGTYFNDDEECEVIGFAWTEEEN